MGDYYPNFLSSVMAGTEGHGDSSPGEFNYPFMPGASMPVDVAPGGYQNFGYFQGYAEAASSSRPKQSNYRRKSTGGNVSGTEQTKHRRTRSGCFMCRSRRVKCDETRPICERCRKGDRECIYPDSQSSKSSSKQKNNATSGQSPNSSSTEDTSQDGWPSKLETIPDQDGNETGYGSTPPLISPITGPDFSESLQRSDKPDHPTTKLSSPAALAMANRLAAPPQLQALHALGMDVSNLPLDYQIHLQYFATNVTNHHYSLSMEIGETFMQVMLSEAGKNESLLNVIVAFSAYLSTVRNPDGKIKDFLQYYNRSVTLLLDALKRKDTHNIPTLLTILQLSTIEEYLGDWINLMGHQKAACEILTSIFTKDNVMDSVAGRICRSWIARNDVVIALLGGFQADLSRDWFTCAVDYYENRKSQEPGELEWNLGERTTSLYVISHEMSVLYSTTVNEEISEQDYSREHRRIVDRLLEWKQALDPRLSDPALAVQIESLKRPVDSMDIVNPYEPNLVFKPPFFHTTLVNIEWHALMVLHISQAKSVSREALGPELEKHGYAICQYFEALECWPETPTGTIMLLQQAVTLASVFLPQDERHSMWLRRKQALIETMGYIHPASRRSKLAGVFKDPSTERWWLPDDVGYTDILRSVRNFADERSNLAARSHIKTLKDCRLLFDKNDE